MVRRTNQGLTATDAAAGTIPGGVTAAEAVAAEARQEASVAETVAEEAHAAKTSSASDQKTEKATRRRVAFFLFRVVDFDIVFSY